MKTEDTYKYSRKKIYIFVFVYKPKDQNKKEKGIGVYLATGDGKEAWSYSGEVSGVKDTVMYAHGFVIGMEKAKEMKADVVELCGSNRNIIKNLAVKKGMANYFMGSLWTEFNKLRSHFFSCQVRNLAENKNKVARRLAKIGAGENIVRKWL